MANDPRKNKLLKLVKFSQDRSLATFEEVLDISHDVKKIKEKNNFDKEEVVSRIDESKKIIEEKIDGFNELNKELIDSTDLYKVIEFANENLIYYEFEHFIDSYEISKCVVFDEKEEEYYDFFSRFYDDSWKECEYRIRYKINKRMLYRTKKDLEYIANVIYSIVDQKREKLSIVYFPMNENNEFVMDVWVKPSIEEIEQIIKMITKKKKSLIVTDKVRERLNEIVNDDNKMLKYVENIIVNILKIVYSFALMKFSMFYLHSISRKIYVH
jgi:hypothetical protein